MFDYEVGQQLSLTWSFFYPYSCQVTLSNKFDAFLCSEWKLKVSTFAHWNTDKTENLSFWRSLFTTRKNISAFLAWNNIICLSLFSEAEVLCYKKKKGWPSSIKSTRWEDKEKSFSIKSSFIAKRNNLRWKTPSACKSGLYWQNLFCKRCKMWQLDSSLLLNPHQVDLNSVAIYTLWSASINLCFLSLPSNGMASWCCTVYQFNFTVYMISLEL